jgi:hypothetical protein
MSPQDSSLTAAFTCVFFRLPYVTSRSYLLAKFLAPIRLNTAVKRLSTSWHPKAARLWGPP